MIIHVYYLCLHIFVINSTETHLHRKKKRCDSVQKALKKCSSLKRREIDQMRHHSQSLRKNEGFFETPRPLKVATQKRWKHVG